MHVIVCLDDAKGMLFHQRRQSRDRVLTEKMQALCKGGRLWLNAYSHGQYGSLEGVQVEVAEDFLRQAARGDYCLVETERLMPVYEEVEQLIVFWWNRKYPADLHLDLDLQGWERVETEEFPGYSHEKITKEVYQKKGNER